MDNQAISSSQPFPNQTQLPVVSKSQLPLIISGIFIVVLASIGGFYLGKKQVAVTTPNLNPLSPTTTKVQEKTITPTLIPSPEVSEFKKISFATFFTYEIPKEWYAGNIWGASSDNGIIIVIDPKPIDTAPRDGPLGRFEILVKNGLQKPEAKFQEDIQKFKDSVNMEKEEVIQSNGFTINYYRGKIKGPFLQGSTLEQYFFMIPRTSDPLNTQVVDASYLHQPDEDLTELFRKVILSIEKIP
ncbi:hypothetical protein HY612_02035 [Candidatus Roizmanbacteria bacterium]|nr:hypothetical protein [Candidatus Roizmanbacteria bacterium]